jgi:hypothetical protein
LPISCWLICSARILASGSSTLIDNSTPLSTLF